MKINVETPYNVGDVIYIFETENVMKYKDLLISKELTFDDFCQYLCVRSRVDYITTYSYLSNDILKTNIYIHCMRRSYDIVNGKTALDVESKVKIEEGSFYFADKSMLTSEGVIKYLKNEYDQDFSEYKADLVQINKHLEKYGFKHPDILTILFDKLINILAIKSADRMYKRDGVQSSNKNGILTGPDLYSYNAHIARVTSSLNGLIIPLISLGIIGEITVGRFKSILKIN